MSGQNSDQTLIERGPTSLIFFVKQEESLRRSNSHVAMTPPFLDVHIVSAATQWVFN
jgi:hypothetical protein